MTNLTSKKNSLLQIIAEIIVVVAAACVRTNQQVARSKCRPQMPEMLCNDWIRINPSKGLLTLYIMGETPVSGKLVYVVKASTVAA